MFTNTIDDNYTLNSANDINLEGDKLKIFHVLM